MSISGRYCQRCGTLEDAHHTLDHRFEATRRAEGRGARADELKKHFATRIADETAATQSSHPALSRFAGAAALASVAFELGVEILVMLERIDDHLNRRGEK
jgi:hypothetical protein